MPLENFSRSFYEECDNGVKWLSCMSNLLLSSLVEWRERSQDQEHALTPAEYQYYYVRVCVCVFVCVCAYFY